MPHEQQPYCLPCAAAACVKGGQAPKKGWSTAHASAEEIPAHSVEFKSTTEFGVNLVSS